MQERTPELSAVASAMLAVIATSPSDLDPQTLSEHVPLSDVSTWIGDLQSLLDAQFIIRVPGPGKYFYRATIEGIRFSRGFLVDRRARA